MCAYANALGPRLSSVVASELLLDLIAVLFALRDQDQVAAKVGDDGAEDGARLRRVLCREERGIELLDHLPRPKEAEVAAR